MSEKSSRMSEWSDQELVNLVWLDSNVDELSEERRRQLPQYKELARKELLRRGFRFRQGGDTPGLESFDELLKGIDVKGGKATPQRIFVSDEEMDKLIGPKGNTPGSTRTAGKQSIFNRLRSRFRKPK